MLAYLKKYSFSPPELGKWTTLPQLWNLTGELEEYEVEAILGHRVSSRKRGNQRFYLVRSKGYEPTKDSGISKYALRNTLELRRKYLQMKNLE